MWKLKSFFGDVLIKSLRLCIHINLAIPSRDLLTSLLKETVTCRICFMKHRSKRREASLVDKWSQKD